MQPYWTLSWSSDAAYFTSRRPLRSSEEMLTHLAPFRKSSSRSREASNRHHSSVRSLRLPRCCPRPNCFHALAKS